MEKLRELSTDAMKSLIGGNDAPTNKPTDNPTIISGGPNNGQVKDDEPVDD